MLFHTHVYFAKKIDKDLDPLTVIGSFIPDLPFTGAITWDDLHKKGPTLKFFDFIKEKYPDHNPLLAGINYHNTLDYFTHVQYQNSSPGFAYQSVSDEIAKLMEKAIDVSFEKAKTVSHNLIETGVNFHLVNLDPKVEEIIKESCSQINIIKLSEIFSSFYGKDKVFMQDSIDKLFHFANDYRMGTLDGAVSFWEDMVNFYLKKDVNIEPLKRALELSIKNTKDSYLQFTNYAINSQDTEIKDSN